MYQSARHGHADAYEHGFSISTTHACFLRLLLFFSSSTGTKPSLDAYLIVISGSELQLPLIPKCASESEQKHHFKLGRVVLTITLSGFIAALGCAPTITRFFFFFFLCACLVEHVSGAQLGSGGRATIMEGLPDDSPDASPRAPWLPSNRRPPDRAPVPDRTGPATTRPELLAPPAIGPASSRRSRTGPTPSISASRATTPAPRRELRRDRAGRDDGARSTGGA